MTDRLPDCPTIHDVPPQVIRRDTLLLGFRGSHAHGMYLPPDNDMGTDDVDLMGCFVAAPECYLSWRTDEGSDHQLDQWDVVNYELTKLARLLLKSNPNVLSLLWLRPEHYLICDPDGQRLIKSRQLFVSRNAFNSFYGYAQSQYKKMFGKNHYAGYMGSKRKALVERFGYDTKYAAHLIRLLRMGVEYLSHGCLFVYRDDAEELLTIKQGGWSFERVQREADRLFGTIKDADAISPLPKEPDTEAVKALVMDIVYRRIEKGKANADTK